MSPSRVLRRVQNEDNLDRATGRVDNIRSGRQREEVIRLGELEDVTRYDHPPERGQDIYELCPSSRRVPPEKAAKNGADRYLRKDSVRSDKRRDDGIALSQPQMQRNRGRQEIEAGSKGV